MRKPPIRNWKNAVNTADEFIDEVSPPAKVEFLVIADLEVMSAALAYATPALMYDGTGSGLSPRRFELMIPPAMNHARAWITRTSHGDAPGVVQAAATIETTSSGGIGSGSPTIITHLPPGTGALGYLDLGNVNATVALHSLTGDLLQDAPGTPLDRQIQVPEGKQPAIEEFSVTLSDGFGLMISPMSR